MPNGKQQFFDTTTKDFLVGGKLFTYAPGTSTFKATYTTAAAAVQNTNPIILDERGEAIIFWDGAYKIALFDAQDNLIYEIDNYYGTPTYPNVNLFNFMSTAEIADVQAGTTTINVTHALTAAANYVGALGGGKVIVPAGKYKISQFILDWCHVLFEGETSGYDYEGSVQKAVQFYCNSGVFCARMEFNTIGGQHSGAYSGFKNIAFTGSVEYGLVITTFATLLDQCTVQGFQYGIMAIGQNSNIYDRLAIIANSKIGFIISDTNNLSITHPNLDFSGTNIVASTTYTVRDCKIRVNDFGLVIREGSHVKMEGITVIESNNQAGLLIYKGTGATVTDIDFSSLWLENNYNGYTSGSTAYSITNYNALKSSSTEYLKGSVSGEWTSAGDAGFSVWIGSQAEDHAGGPASYITFNHGQIGCNSAQQKNLKIRSARWTKFYDVAILGGNTTLGLSLQTFADYTHFYESNTDISSLNSGLIGGNRSAVFFADQNADGGIYMAQGGHIYGAGYGIKFAGGKNNNPNANTLDSYQESTGINFTLTGITATVTGTGSATLIGNTVILDIPGIGGTSNSSSKTYTGLPVVFAPVTDKLFLVGALDNGGAYVASLMVVNAGTGVINFYANANGTGFTGSGTCAIRAGSFAYTLN